MLSTGLHLASESTARSVVTLGQARYGWRTRAVEYPAINVRRYPIADAGTAFNVSRWSVENIDVRKRGGDRYKNCKDGETSHGPSLQ